MWCAYLRACMLSVGVGGVERHVKGLISTWLARRYVLLYEKITGRNFEILCSKEDLHSEMAACVGAALKTGSNVTGEL